MTSFTTRRQDPGEPPRGSTHPDQTVDGAPAAARRDGLTLHGLLEAVEAAPPISSAEVFGAALAATLGAREVSFLIADFSGQSLIRLSHVAHGDDDGSAPTRERAEAVPLVGTPHGRVLAEQRIEVVDNDGDLRLFAPVTSRGEAVGVLELSLDEHPDEETQAAVADAAHALAYVVIANRRFTDLYEWGQRSMPLSLEAEIQRRLLPGSYTCEGGQFTLAGWLEPAGEVGGDTFDFSLERDTLHLSITDAMGHTVDAALLATILVGALRNGRRRGLDLVDQAQLAHDSLAEHAADRGAFVTGQLVRIDLNSGSARILNAGHPPPLRIRDGRAERISLQPDSPFAAPRAGRYSAQALDLRAGDRLVFLTDGMLERNAADVDVGSVLADCAALHPREAVQQLTRAVVAACGGKLHDDATVLCLDWHGGPPRDRDASAGADR
jgi:serine phosphatase RsbU (regulator of sigma subunit)